MKIYVHVDIENYVYMFDNYVYTFASFAFLYTCMPQFLLYTCTLMDVHNFFVVDIWDYDRDTKVYIYFFRNLFIIERSCNHWPINSKVYIFTIATKVFLCHTSKFFLYTCTPQFILYTCRLTDVHNFFVVDIWNYDSEG